MTEKTKEPFWKSSLALSALSAAIVFFGFKPLFDLTPDGISKEVLVAGIGALFVTFVTLVLLKRQTETQERQKQSETLYAKKIDIYFDAMKKLEDIVSKERLSKKDMNELSFSAFNLQIVGNAKAFEIYYEAIKDLRSAGEDKFETSPKTESELDEVELDEDSMSNLFERIHSFSNACRLDLKLEELSQRVASQALGTASASSQVRKELDGGFDEFSKLRGVESNVRQEQLAHLIQSLTKGVDLVEKYARTQISLVRNITNGKRKNLAYIGVQKSVITLGFGGVEDKSVIDGFTKQLENEYGAVTKKWKNKFGVEIRFPWREEGESVDKLDKLIDVMKQCRDCLDSTGTGY